jgi:hypothetical protein
MTNFPSSRVRSAMLTEGTLSPFPAEVGQAGLNGLTEMPKHWRYLKESLANKRTQSRE